MLDHSRKVSIRVGEFQSDKILVLKWLYFGFGLKDSFFICVLDLVINI